MYIKNTEGNPNKGMGSKFRRKEFAYTKETQVQSGNPNAERKSELKEGIQIQEEIPYTGRKPNSGREFFIGREFQYGEGIQQCEMIPYLS
jgi:hypothetical protein